MSMGNSGIATTAAAPRTGTVEVLVGLLAELDAATESGVFYDRVCRAVCSLTTMRRAALLLHDNTYRTVIPMGSHGVDPELVDDVIAGAVTQVGDQAVNIARNAVSVSYTHLTLPTILLV